MTAGNIQKRSKTDANILKRSKTGTRSRLKRKTKAADLNMYYDTDVKQELISIVDFGCPILRTGI